MATQSKPPNLLTLMATDQWSDASLLHAVGFPTKVQEMVRTVASLQRKSHYTRGSSGHICFHGCLKMSKSHINCTVQLKVQATWGSKFCCSISQMSPFAHTWFFWIVFLLRSAGTSAHCGFCTETSVLQPRSTDHTHCNTGLPRAPVKNGKGKNKSCDTIQVIEK